MSWFKYMGIASKMAVLSFLWYSWLITYLTFLIFQGSCFFFLRDQGKRQLPDPKFYYVLIVSPVGKYFVPDLNRASQV